MVRCSSARWGEPRAPLGKFIMGLQFHPERMRKPGSDELKYPGCPKAYREFVRAAVAYESTLAVVPTRVHRAAVTALAVPKMSHGVEKQRKVLLRNFSLAKNMHFGGGGGDTKKPATEVERRGLDAGDEFLETAAAAALSSQQEKRLKQKGATVRNATGYLNTRLKVSEDKEAAARALMAKMSAAQLSSLAAFYRAMGNICADVLDAKLQPAAATLHQ